MGVAAGKYDRRITLQENQTSLPTASGQRTAEWVDVAVDIPARYVDESQSGNQTYEGEQRVSNNNVTFHIRDPRGTYPVQAGMQLLYNGNTYNIYEVAEISRNVALVVRAQRKDNT